MESDFYAQLFGAVIGGLVCIYLIGKLFEWLFFKRFIKNSNHVIFAGSITGFLVVFLLWAKSPTVVAEFSIFSFFIAAILLVIIRIQWRKRKAKREITSRTDIDQKNSHSSTQASRVIDVAEHEKCSQISSVSIPTDIDEHEEDTIYTIVAEELESGNTDKGLWTRLFAECGGDEKQVKTLYITRRVEKLMGVEKARRQLIQNQETARLEPDALINMTAVVKKSVWPKVLGGLALVAVAFACAIAYRMWEEWDRKRVMPATGLADVELGIRQEEVTAKFGRQPDCPVTKTENEIKMSYNRRSTACGFIVTLNKDIDGVYRTAMICEWNGYLPNLPEYESAVIKKLGKPDLESFSADGTHKISNYKKYNLSLLFKGGKNLKICVDKEPDLVFANEFKPS